jgi:hypothetical protein
MGADLLLLNRIRRPSPTGVGGCRRLVAWMTWQAWLAASAARWAPTWSPVTFLLLGGPPPTPPTG